MENNTGISKSIYAYKYAIGAAALFGASTPLAKLFLDEFQPVSLAACFYLGCGLGISILFFVRNTLFYEKTREIPRLERNDLPWLTGAIIVGGIFAPVLMLSGLSITTAATASLLLNFEAAATTIIAYFIFRENLSKKSISALALITLAGILLSSTGSGDYAFSFGAFAVIIACILWGFENNMTCRISGKDPVAITAIKGVSAGICLLTAAFLLKETFPSPSVIAGSMLLGFLCYGLSIYFFIKSLNTTGAARTSSMFAASPFVGAMVSFLLFPGYPGISYFAAFAIMAAGAFLLFSENGKFKIFAASASMSEKMKDEDEIS